MRGMKVADIEVKNNRSGEPKGDGSASGPSGETSAGTKKKASKARDTRVVIDENIVFSPCNLMVNDGGGGELKFVQDWIVEQADVAGTYRIMNRATNQPYDTLTVDEWRQKCAHVKNAMVDAYKRSNFGPMLESQPSFCDVEAKRLIPDFVSVLGAFGDLASGPVQTAAEGLNYETFFKLASREYGTREKVYNWSTSPLETSNIEFAAQRYVKAMRDGNLNVAVFSPGTPLFPVEDVKLITNAMHRPPSNLTTVSGYMQTWVYNKDANQMVPRTWEIGNAYPAPSLVEGYKANFTSVRDEMIAAYSEFWFPNDTDEVDVGGKKTTFGDWKLEIKFDQTKEIGAIIPEFHPMWGYMKHQYAHTKPGVPGTSKSGKKHDNVLDHSKVAYSFKGLETGGYEEAVKRFASLQLDLRKGKNRQLVAVARLPLDYMWSRSPGPDKTAAVERATPDSMKKKGSGSTQPGRPPPDKFAGMLAGTYLRLQQEIKSKRRSRTRKLGQDTKELEEGLSSAAPGQAETIRAQIADLERNDKDEFASEEKQLQDLYHLKSSTNENFAEEEQDAYFKKISDDEKVTFLRRVFASNMKGKRNKMVKQNEQFRFLDSLKRALQKSDRKDSLLETEIQLITSGRESSLVSSKGYIAMPPDKKAATFARVKEKNANFRELVAMSPEKRAEALKPKPKAARAKGEKVGRKKRKSKASKKVYLDMDWEDKMKEDELRRISALKDLEKDKNRKAAWISFRELLEPADEAEREALFSYDGRELRNEKVYKVIFARIEASQKDEKSSLNGIAQTVLQHTFYPEYKEYVKQTKYDRLSDEEKAKLKKKDDDSVRLEQIKLLISENKLPEAAALIDADHKTRVEGGQALRKEGYVTLAEEVKTYHMKAVEDPDSYDSAEFTDLWMTEIEKVIKEYDFSEYISEQNFIYWSEDIKATPRDDVLDMIDSIKEKFDSSSKLRLQRVLQFVDEYELADVLDDNIVALARIESQGQVEKEKQRDKRDQAVLSIYTKINNERKLLVGLAADKQLEKLEKLDIRREMRIINEIDDEIQSKKEVAEFQHKVAVAKDKALREFSNMLKSMKEYEDISSTPVMAKLIEDGSVERPPSLLKEGLDWKTLKDSVLSPSAAASMPPIKSAKPKKERDLYYFLEKAQDAADREAAKFWTRKERRGLDERNEDDRADLEFTVGDDEILYDTEISDASKGAVVKDNLATLWAITQRDPTTGLVKKIFAQWIRDQQKLFLDEQESLREAGVLTTPYSRENLVAFVAAGLLTSEFDQDGFQLIQRLPDNDNLVDNTGGVTTLSAWTDTDGNVVFYDEDGDEEARINYYDFKAGRAFGPKDTTTKQTLAINLSQNDVDMYFPDDLMDELKPFMWIRTVSDPPGTPLQTFYSIFRPWQADELEDQRKAFARTLEQMTNWTAAVFAQDFVKPGPYDTEEKVVTLLKTYEGYGFCSVDTKTNRVQINSNMFSATNFKSLPSDGTESAARKKERARAAQDFKEWIDKHWPEIYKDEAKANESAIDTSKKSGAVADDSDDEGEIGDDYSGDEDGGEDDGEEMEEGKEQRATEDVRDNEDLSDVDEGDLPDEVPLVDLPDAAAGDDEEEGDDDDEEDGDYEDGEDSDVEEEYDENAMSDDSEQGAGEAMEEDPEDDSEDDGKLEVLPQGGDSTPTAGTSVAVAPSLASSMRSLSVAPTRPVKQTAWWGQRSSWWSPSYGP